MKTKTILTDGGLETDLIFNRGIDLHDFAAFPLLEQPEHLEVLMNYYREYLNMAEQYDTGFILESPTWRANLDWGQKLGYDDRNLIRVNQLAIRKMQFLKKEYENRVSDIQVSGQIGPRGDGYHVQDTMNCFDSMRYHELQVKAFKKADADFITAITMTYSEEALGIVKAAQLYDLPVVISFTVETDGRVPSGEGLEDSILKLDTISNDYPSYYMINCAHPTHFAHLFEGDGVWKQRIQGLRANASCKSHAELDEATELDIGDREDLGRWHATLK